MGILTARGIETTINPKHDATDQRSQKLIHPRPKPYHSGSPSGVELGAIIGAVLACTFILLTVFFLFVKKCISRQQKKDIDVEFNDSASQSSSRSAPSTRHPSPHLCSTRKCSSAGTGKSPPGYKQRSPLIHSLTVDAIPGFQLPPERVQPPNSMEARNSITAIHYQRNSLGAFQPELYRLSDGEERAAMSPCGRLWFSLTYDVTVDRLTVTLIKAKYLKGRNKTNAPRDPFVKLYLLPDERTCQQSRVRRKTLSPKFNETFVFLVKANELSTRTLRFSVYDVDKRRVRYSLGHVLLPLSDTDLISGDEMWRDLEPVSQNSACLGEMNFTLTYLPNMEKIKVVIICARNLKKLELDPDTEIYTRIQLIHGRKIHKTKRTASQLVSVEPTYTESFSFRVPGRKMDNISMVISVMTSSKGHLGLHEQEYGRVVLGSFLFSRGEELMHWQEMLSQPRTAITRWHSLSTVPDHSASD